MPAHVPVCEQDILVFRGSASPRLTAAICGRLGVAMGESEVIRFSEGNLFVRILENVRGRRIYVVQSTVFPANDHFMELLFWIDAFKRASAASVTVIIPYFSYAKGDKKDEPRVSIRARVCADAVQVAGADRIVTIDLHAPQIQGFFTVPVDDLQALPVLVEAVQALALPEPVVVAPDHGFAKRAARFAERLGAPLAIGYKRRTGHDEQAQAVEVLGEVRGRSCVIVDDLVISGGTLIEVGRLLHERGASAVVAAVTHGVFSRGSMELLDRGGIARLFVTDTIENQPVELSPKIEVVSVAPLLAEAIRRIQHRESISVLFS